MAIDILREKLERYSPISLLNSSSQKLDKTEYLVQFKADSVLSDDPAQLLPQLLDKMTELGQMAQQLSQALGGNGHRPEQAAQLIEELAGYGGTLY